jgi:hypothetical protein
MGKNMIRLLDGKQKLRQRLPGLVVLVATTPPNFGTQLHLSGSWPQRNGHTPDQDIIATCADRPRSEIMVITDETKTQRRWAKF